MPENNAASPARKHLDSWKEIADYIGRDVRTAIRWEQQHGLPVHRLPGGRRSAVFAVPDEIDSWVQNRPASHETSARIAPSVFSRRPTKLFVLLTLFVAVTAAAVLFIRVRHRGDSSDQLLTLGTPDKPFRFARSIFSYQLGAIRVVAGDLNEDGYPDLVIDGAPSARTAILFNHQGRFVQPTYLQSCASAMTSTVADFDGDGHLDIAFACHDSNELEVWWGNGTGLFPSSVRIPTGKDPDYTAAADFNNDGLPDIVVDAPTGPYVLLLLSSRDRSFRRVEIPLQKSFWAVPFDFDRDGKTDLIVSCVEADCSYLTLLKGYGDGTFSAPTKLATEGGPWSATAADFTGDGIPDLATGSPFGGVMLLQGLSTGGFAPERKVTHTMGANLTSAFLDNGKTYLLISEMYRGSLQLADVDHGIVRAVSQPAELHTSLRFVAVADFNRDGRADLAVLAFDHGESRVNILYQLPD